MNIKTFTVNDFWENCYLLWDEDSKETAIIDCGAYTQSEWETINNTITQLDLKPKYALQTHCHFDHIMGLGFVNKAYGLVPMYHKLEEMVYKAMPQMAAQFGLAFPDNLPQEKILLDNGQKLTLGNNTLCVIHTPGHTPGGVCFHIATDNILFSGDTLFRGNVGRTDLGGDMHQERQSIRNKILTLPEQTKVYTGHGPSTTVAWEKVHNPYANMGEKDFL